MSSKNHWTPPSKTVTSCMDEPKAYYIWAIKCTERLRNNSNKWFPNKYNHSKYQKGFWFHIFLPYLWKLFLVLIYFFLPILITSILSFIHSNFWFVYFYPFSNVSWTIKTSVSRTKWFRGPQKVRRKSGFYDPRSTWKRSGNSVLDI